MKNDDLRNDTLIRKNTAEFCRTIRIKEIREQWLAVLKPRIAELNEKLKSDSCKASTFEILNYNQAILKHMDY